MIVGNFNYHQILFALDSFYNLDDKIGYLEKIHSELVRIITCFEMPKSLPLKMYASKTMQINGSCQELKDFIKAQFDLATSNPYDSRYPGEAQLRSLVRVELVNYKKMHSVVEDELKSILTMQNKLATEKKKAMGKENNFIIPQKNTPKDIAEILETKAGKVVWKNSVGELIELIKVIIILDLIHNLDDDDIIPFICSNFVDSNYEKFSPFQIEKVYKMLANTFWLNGKNSEPKFFQ